MDEENKKKYLHLVIGYAGLLLLGLAVLRLVNQDTTAFVLTMFGYICLATYFQFADRKIGASTKEKIIFRVGHLVILGVFAFLM